MENYRIIVIGAGIVGVSTALWLGRAGHKVTLIDKGTPGMGASYGNAGLLARCASDPISFPGMWRKAPGYLLNPDYPLFLRWSYLPRIAPWLVRLLANSSDRRTRQITQAVGGIVSDSVDQHLALAEGSEAAKYIVQSPYAFAFKDRKALDKEAYTWELKASTGFVPDVLHGRSVQEYDPNLGSEIGALAVFQDHGYITNPAAYVAALTQQFQKEGGIFKQVEAHDLEITDGRVTGVPTADGVLQCDRAVICSGAWSKALTRRLGVRVPLDTERGYHLLLKNPSFAPRYPVMISSGKFVLTPMEDGLRCAGIVELGGLEAGPSQGPLRLLRKHLKRTFPTLTWDGEEEWMGFRPTLPDSIPMIGEINASGVYAGFGHQHIGLTAGPKTGRLLAEEITYGISNVDLSPYDPTRFAG